MIYDHIDNAELYAAIPDLGGALRYLARIGAPGGPSMPAGRVELDGARVFLSPVSLTTKPVDECHYEAHRRYIDVHYIVRGVEGIATRRVGELAPRGAFDEEKDIGFYDGAPDGTYFLRPGTFMVCWPQDAHRVAQMLDAPAPVEKIVVKIRV